MTAVSGDVVNVALSGGHSIGGAHLDVDLEGNMLIMMNQDVPGVIGQVGTLMGEHGVNIAEWRLGRTEKDDLALAFINLDSDLSDEVMTEIQALPAIRKLKLVRF